MTEDEIVGKVKLAIDESSGQSGGALSGEDGSLDEIVKDKIGYAYAWLMENVPLDRLESGNITTYEEGVKTPGGTSEVKVKRERDGVVRLTLPDGVLRVVSARMASWPYSPPVVSEYSETALLQQSRTGMGSPDMPVTVLCSRNGKEELLLYTADGESDTASVQYVKPKGGSEDYENVGGKIEKSFIYYIAFLTLLAMRDGSAQSFYAVATQEIKRGEQNG